MEVDHLDEGLRAISTKSLEEQRQLLGTLEALNGMLLFGLTTAFLLAIRGGTAALVFFGV